MTNPDPVEQVDKLLQIIYDAGKNRKATGIYESGQIAIKAGLKIKKLIHQAHNKGRVEQTKWIASFNPTGHREFKQVIKSCLKALKDKE